MGRIGTTGKESGKERGGRKESTRICNEESEKGKRGTWGGGGDRRV